MTDHKTPPVIILGMHRSGTSLITGLLQENGVMLGEVNTAAKNNKRGNRELVVLQKIHERIFARLGATWNAPPRPPIELEDIEEDAICKALAPFENEPLWGFKDPRTVWLIENYLRLFPAARLIGVFRHPMAVAHSLASRPGTLKISFENGLDLWKDTNERIIKLHERYGFPLLHFAADDHGDWRFNLPLQRFLQGLGRTSYSSSFFEPSLISQSHNLSIEDKHVERIYDRLLEIGATEPEPQNNRA